MLSAPADHLPGRWPRILVALLLSAGVLTGCSEDTSIAPPTASSAGADAREAAGRDTVDRLGEALRDADPASAAALGVPALAAQLRAAATNVDRLDLVDLELRYVDDVPSAPGVAAASVPGAWEATVSVRYRLRDWDDQPTTVETTLSFAPDGGGGQLVSEIGGSGGRTPLWLAGPVAVRAQGRTLVLSRDGNGRRDSRLARRAVEDVNRVLPAWGGTLVLEAAASETEFDSALGATARQYANIAAVTASVDGSLTPGSPVHVFLNPAVFDDLGGRGAQVVVSHEATHVATQGTFAVMPTWLLEGFADYVALAHAGIDVRTAAAQALRRIRADGLPDGLPSDEDLSPTAGGLGATYEVAWLATRSIARRYGEAKLIAFYDAVDSGQTTAAAFAEVLGITEAVFVRQWRADLKTLAGPLAG